MAPGWRKKQINIGQFFRQIGLEQQRCGIPVADIGGGLHAADIAAAVGGKSDIDCCHPRKQ